MPRIPPPGCSRRAYAYPDYVDLRDACRSFDGLVAGSYSMFGFSSSPDTTPHMQFGLYVSGNFFRVLGVTPPIGRDFRPDEDQVEGRDSVVILGHDFWVSTFRADPSAIGSRIRLNGVDLTIIGVAPEQFTGIDALIRPTLFVPITASARLGHQNRLRDRDAGWLFVKGRLKSGTSVQQANAQVAAISSGLIKLHKQPAVTEALGVTTELELRIRQSPPMIAMVTMLGVLGLCVLMVACANVAGLLLSRGRARSREIAIRLAIGAGRGPLIRQLLVENILVALAGGALGVLLADAIADFWRKVPVPTDLPVGYTIGVDRRVLLFTLVVSAFSTILFGLVPALRITRPDLVPALKAADADCAGHGSRLWGRNTIVASQVAISLVLLLVSAVMVQGFRDLFMQGPGYRTDHLYLTSFDTRMVNYSEVQTQRFYHGLLEHARRSPGVRAADLTSAVPLAGAEMAGVVPEGWPAPRGARFPEILTVYISDGYLRTMDIPVLRGRGFTESDGEGTPPVATVNEAMAGHYWPKGDAIGHRLHLQTADGPLIQIVGIAKRSKYTWIAEPAIDCVYMPYQQHPRTALSLVTLSDAADAGSLAPVVRGVVRSLDPEMPVFDARTMHDLYTQRAIKTPLIIIQVVTGLGVMGLALAMVGLYGLVAYSVNRRTHEIAIRMAIGADPDRASRMVLRQGLKLGIIGVIAGLVAGFFVCRALITGLATAFSFGNLNPFVFAGVAILLLGITALAAWGPAHRASRVDPMRVLRDE